ncbi:hybrid sensor histidine kinase/response regulator [Arcobacter roscoffensis]|uniref:histidine kinase n=1 Tax=Arcobacter roscoffensis TaxID=2961520 RepID=A0ABY5E0H7_9BACT|nr:hybrid sensor histidine kinase/response regulator [Arcobacter roscoffensis]UTJ05701.1 hybrid sensor histidine kinase/response regulator [Arcobacter roscoffensis]
MIGEEVLKNITVLYVEDESLLQEGTTETLELFDINVICAQNGEDGLSTYRLMQDKIDLVLTDIKMPKLNGIDMIKSIREINKEIPVIITTAHQETNFLMKSIELNINAYVLKPIDIYKLKDTLIKAMESKVLKDKLRKKNQELELAIQEIEKKQKLMEVQSRFAAMGEMIAMIAHQWRQPLASIGTVSFNLKNKLLSGKYDLETKEGRFEQTEFFNKKLDDIEGYVQNLTNTIDDFRNFFKSDKIITKTKIENTIKNSIKMINKDFQTNDININFDFKSKSDVNIYENEMAHVFINILKNAQEKLLEKQSNREIKIITEDIEDSVKIEIKDNGGGIDKENMSLIFEPYFSTKKEKNGTGIGLYMSKVIVENNHKGKLLVSNTTEGACFTIVLNTLV